MSYPSTNSSQTNVITDKGWRLRHSAWLLAPILGFGILSFIGFLYVGLRVRTKKFWVAAAVGSTGSSVAWVVLALSGDLEETSKTSSAATSSGAETMSDQGAGVLLAVWVALVIYAVVLNRDYLRWRAGHTEAKAWYNQHTMNPASGYAQTPSLGQPQAAPPGFLGVEQDDYYAPSQPPAAPTYRTPPPAPNQAPQAPPARAVDAVDVNSTSADVLAHSLDVEPDLALRVIAFRDSRGGFANADDMVSVVGLQPHQFLKFRDKVVFGPRPSRPDASPTAPTTARDQDKPRGRIIDI